MSTLLHNWKFLLSWISYRSFIFSTLIWRLKIAAFTWSFTSFHLYKDILTSREGTIREDLPYCITRCRRCYHARQACGSYLSYHDLGPASLVPNLLFYDFHNGQHFDKWPKFPRVTAEGRSAALLSDNVLSNRDALPFYDGGGVWKKLW